MRVQMKAERKSSRNLLNYSSLRYNNMQPDTKSTVANIKSSWFSCGTKTRTTHPYNSYQHFVEVYSPILLDTDDTSQHVTHEYHSIERADVHDG